MPLIIFLYALWTCSFPIGKITLAVTTPIFLTACRMLFAAFLLFTFLAIANRKGLKISKKHILPLMLLAVFSIYLTNILEFWGLQYLPAAKTCFLYSFCPFFAAMLSFFHFKEKMTKKKWLGLFIGILGFIPVLLQKTSQESLLGGMGFFSWPALAIIGAAFCSVYGWVILRVIVKDNSLSPITANSYSMLIGGVFALLHSLFSDHWSFLPITTNGAATFIRGLVFMTLISNILCYNLYGYLLKKYTATFLSFMGLLSPFFASLTGWLFLKEPFSLTIAGSTLIIIFGLWIVYKEELKQGYIIQNKKQETLQQEN